MNKYFKYLFYLIRHKWFVFLTSFKLGIPFRGLAHDMSKFLPSEFIPYVKFFYGDSLNSEDFDIAWLKHQHRNPHHWQYWILKQDNGPLKVLRMPDQYVVEMVADWAGAGRAINGRYEVKEWYNKNKDVIALHSYSRKLAEKLIDKIEKVNNDLL